MGSLQSTPSPSCEGFVFGVDAGGTNCRVQCFDCSSLEPVGQPIKFAWDFSRIFGEYRGLSLDSVLTEAELEAGSRQIDALAKAVATIWAQVNQGGGRAPAICLAWPGQKCPAAHSIVRCSNAPRISDFVPRLQREVERFGGVSPHILPLQSDGFMAGLAEFRHPQGALLGLEQGYYLMPGTGLAEAFVVDGQIRSRHELGLAGPFELEYQPGQLYEQLLKASAWRDAPRLGPVLQSWLQLRSDQCPRPWQAVALGGRATSGNAWESQLPFSLRWSQLVDPALWGCAHFATRGL